MDADGREDPARPDDRRTSDGRVLAWAPGLTDCAGSSAASSETGTGPRDRLETGAPPDFGSPMSIVPPRTCRRAAWVAVAASCAILAALVFAAARLTGGPFQRIDAFPGLPTGGLLTAQPQRSAAHLGAATTAPADQDGAAASIDSADVDAGNAPGNGGPKDDTEQARPHLTETASPTDPGLRSQTGPPPMVTILPATGRPPVAPADLVAATTAFYSQLPDNIEGAWAMVAPRARAQGFEAFRTQWADTTDVQLKKMVVSPDDSTVLATVKLVTSDGSKRDQQYRMVFRGVGPPAIDEITPITADDEGDQGDEPAK